MHRLGHLAMKMWDYEREAERLSTQTPFMHLSMII